MKISVLLIISFFTISSSCQNSENSTSEIIDLRKEINLIDAVKSIKHRTYAIEGQDFFLNKEKGKKYCYSQIRIPVAVFSRSHNYDVTFNSRGQMLNLIEFDNDGEETLNQNFIIGKYGNLLEYTSKSDNKTTKGIIEIGQNGKVKMTKVYNSENKLERYMKMEYNKLQKPILRQDFKNNHVLESKDTLQYINGKTIITHYGQNGEFSSLSIYNSKNKIVEIDGLIISTEYNDENKIIKETSLKEKTNIEYNSEGAIVKVEVSGEDQNYKYTNKVDNKLNIISQIYVLDKERITRITCKYKYDNHGNWIERIESAFDEPICVTKRDIKYY